MFYYITQAGHYTLDGKVLYQLNHLTGPHVLFLRAWDLKNSNKNSQKYNFPFLNFSILNQTFERMLSFSHNQFTLTVHEYLPMSAMSHAKLRMYRAFRLSKDLASYILKLDKHKKKKTTNVG